MSATPLAGVLVVDLSRHLPGPLAARILRDLGARVIKIEEPELGDPVRLAPPIEGGRSALAQLLLAGVESVALDLKRERALGALEGLLAKADALLETFRPGTLARFGLGPERLAERFPRLVVCSLSGWGQEGSHAGRAGHDLTYQALAGSLAPTGEMPAVPMADVTGAWACSTAILAALVERGRTGRGRWIDAALFDAATHANLTALAAEAAGPRAVGERLPLTGALPCYNLYRSSGGGLVALAALEAKFWRVFCKAVDRSDLLPLQYRDDDESRRRVAELVATRTREEWQKLFTEHDLPGDPVLSAAETAVHPQAGERGLTRTSAEGLPRLAFPALFGGERPRSAERVPALGEDTMEVLEEFGLLPAGASRRELRRAGIGPRQTIRGRVRKKAVERLSR